MESPARALSRSLSDSQTVSGCKRRSASRSILVEETSCSEGTSGTRMWVCLAALPDHSLSVNFIHGEESTPAEGIVVHEKVVAFSVPSLGSSDMETTLTICSQQTSTFVSTPSTASSLVDFATSGDSLSLVQPFASQIHTLDEDGNNVLHIASRNCQNYALKIFLTVLQAEPEESRRKSMNHKNSRGWSPLHCAVHAGDADSVHYLLSYGAEMNSLDNHNNSVLHYLSDTHNEAIYKEIIERPSVGEILEGKNDEGFTPLHLAVKRLKLGLIELLLDVSANPNEVDEEGKTAIMHAALLNDVEIVQYLLSKGADPNVEDTEGNNPLLLSSQVANYVIMGMLLDAGADPKKKTKKEICLADSDDSTVQNIINGERMQQMFKDSSDGLVRQRPPLFGHSARTSTQEPQEHSDEGETLDEEPSTSTAGTRRRSSAAKHSSFSKDDISCLDYLTRLRLSKILDETSKWEALARELECEHMVELIAICSTDSSPTMILLDQFEQLPDAKISRVREALERLHEEQAVQLIEERFVY